MYYTTRYLYFSASFEFDSVLYAVIRANPSVSQSTAASVCSDKFQGEIFYNQTSLDCIVRKLVPLFSPPTEMLIGGKTTVKIHDTVPQLGKEGNRVRVIFEKGRDILFTIWRSWVQTPVGSNLGCVVLLSVVLEPKYICHFVVYHK